MTIKEAAAVWGIPQRSINEFCRSGRIPGAYKNGRQWIIPDDAQKPCNQRIQASAFLPHKPLPVGVSDYRDACSNYYYVDKTLLIKDILDERSKVSLFTRPRRFGKTLNMDMLRVFFEKNESEDTSVYFRHKKIWRCGKKYCDYQGLFPVIFLSFKDVKFSSWEETCQMLCKLIAAEFRRHSELLSSRALSDYEKHQFLSLSQETANEVDYQMSLQILSLLLHKHHCSAPIIIIDEYDTPIQQGHVSGFYNEVIGFMRNLFSGGLKDNSHLSFGFLTGILRVAKESIFSGLNNLKINSILDDRYSEYFGFTGTEVQQMAAYYNVTANYSELCEWYDGYRFGHTDIFNPWSVICYFNNNCRPKAFWLSTGSNDIIREILDIATPEILEHLESLLQGNSFLTHIDTDVIYPQLPNDPSSIYSFLLVTGYLKAINCSPSYGEDYLCNVAIPNREISFVYRKEILSRLESLIPHSFTTGIQEALYQMNPDLLQEKIAVFLMESISFYDASNESFYHGLLLGLCAILDDKYRIVSNRESGDGRFDIQMIPRISQLPGILIELKAAKNCSQEQLKKLAQTALQQINDRSYASELHSAGVHSILKYGIAFSGKKISVLADSFNLS